MSNSRGELYNSRLVGRENYTNRATITVSTSPYSSAKALIMKLIRKKARWTGDPGSSISNSRPAGKFALWAPKPPPRLLPPPSLPPGKVVRAEARKEIKYILSAGPFVQVTLGFQASQLNE